MSLKLHSADMSPPCRAVYLLLEDLGLKYEKVIIDLRAGDHLKPEFVKINPQHTIPTLEDGDFKLWDSHAILTYVASKYAKNDSLYPKDLQKRATVDQRLHYDSSKVGKTFSAIAMPLIFKGATAITDDQKKDMENVYALLNTFLEGSDWIAGKDRSIADYSIVAVISTIDIVIPVDKTKYPNLNNWLKRLQQLPFYENANGIGARQLGAYLKEKLK